MLIGKVEFRVGGFFGFGLFLNLVVFSFGDSFEGLKRS